MMNRREEIEARLYQLSVRPMEPKSVAAMHEAQRHAEPPKPWTLALRDRGVKDAAKHSGNEPPKPYTLALQRRAAEAR